MLRKLRFFAFKDNLWTKLSAIKRYTLNKGSLFAITAISYILLILVF